MADLSFIGGPIDWLVGVLGGDDLAEALRAAGLTVFTPVRKSWTGTEANWPPVAVMPRTSTFDPEGTGRHQAHELTIRFGVSGPDPDTLTERSVAYMGAIDQAVNGAAWPASVLRVFVAQHDYGPLYSGGAGGFARFPEMHIVVETHEYDGTI